MHAANVLLAWLVIREMTAAEGGTEQVLAPLLAKGLEAAVREMDVSRAHLLFANADESAVLE